MLIDLTEMAVNRLAQDIALAFADGLITKDEMHTRLSQLREMGELSKKVAEKRHDQIRTTGVML